MGMPHPVMGEAVVAFLMEEMMAVYEPGIVVQKGQWITKDDESIIYFIDKVIACETNEQARLFYESRARLKQHERKGP